MDSAAEMDASGLPVETHAPEPGQRIEIDLTGARAELVDGKIEVTLPNGGVLVLFGEAVEKFLAGYADALEAALAPAAGWTEVQRFLIPLEPAGHLQATSMQD